MCGRYVVKNPVTKTSSLVKSAIQVEDTENYNAHGNFVFESIYENINYQRRVYPVTGD
jgi:hypothetical protein